MPTSRHSFDLSKDAVRLGCLDELMTVQIRRADLFLSQAFNAAVEQEGIGEAIISALALIEANPGISQQELSRWTGIDKSGLVTVIDELEKAGWTVREKSSADRRRNALHATPAGKARIETLVETARTFEAAMLASVSDKEQDRIRKLLHKIFRSCARHGAAIVQDVNARPSRTKP